MRLIRFGEPGAERPGVLLDQDQRKDLSAQFRDWDRSFFEQGGVERLAAIIGEQAAALPDVPREARWAAPVPRPGKVIGIGLNFSDHAAETGQAEPEEPVIFAKAANTVVGPYDAIEIPPGSQKTDWEVELGVVLGREARRLSTQNDGTRCIAGYCISHDVSEREYQLERGGQWLKGKSCDTFNPLGPWLATDPTLGDAPNLAMRLEVNGQRMQTGSTGKMIFSPSYIVYYLSQFMTLEPGDVISTGTPPGVGLGQKPPRFLKPGDLVELAIDRLGTQRQTCQGG
jgi:2-keto-4-pentenoate hydratase/2-oxohepta-3-ene-1,7-dioic acid hydratase in catechol pathway